MTPKNSLPGGPIARALADVATSGIHRFPYSMPVEIDANPDGAPSIHQTTWGDFLTDNLDGIAAGDVDAEAIVACWIEDPDATYHGGGGAMGRWTIRRTTP